jgi:imidazolonepropionase-like amidohydrolase
MKLRFVTSLAFFTFFAASQTFAQYVPVVAPPQTQAIVVRGATAHLGNGLVIENSVVAFEAGKFTVVADDRAKREFPNHKVVDATGKHLYPGFIAPNSTLGLTEIGGVRATQDNSEIGEMNPNIRSIVAFNTDSEVTPTVRSMGVLMAEVTPQGGRISGTSSIVQLDAWNWEDAAYATDIAMHLNWPATSSFNWREQRVIKNEKYDEQLQELELFFKQAQAYHQKVKPETPNLRFEAMKGLFDSSKRLFIHADNVQSIQEAVLFAEKFQLKPVIVGGRDSWMITDFLKSHGVPVVIRSTQSLPGREDEDIDQPFKTPALLQAAGVEWCFSHEEYWQQRNLPFQAGQAIPFGLAYEDAIKALTSSTAKIFGIDKKVGTIEAGKDATLFISEGDVLDMRTSKVTSAFIQGREINLDNKQEILYRRFQMKYKQR